MTKRFLNKAVTALAGDAHYDATDTEIINWKSPDITEPSQADIEAKIVELQAEYDAQEYARARKAEYDVLNQFELISDDSANNTTTHVDAIAAIKLKHPKS